MKQFSFLIAIVASLSLSEVPEATAVDYSQLLPSCIFDNLPEANRGQSKAWKTSVYNLHGEDVEVALPSGQFTFQETDGQLLLQLQKGNEYFVISATSNGGVRPESKQFGDTVVTVLEDSLAAQGGKVGLPKYSQRGSMDVVELLVRIPSSGGTVYMKTAFFISDTNIYSLAATYFNAPSSNVTRFMNAFRLIE